MTMLPKERGQVLILLAMWLFFGGGAASALVAYDRPASEVKKAIKRVITDGRTDAILSDVDQWESAQKKQDKKVSAERDELLKTLRREDAQRSEAEPIIARLDETFVEMDRDFLDLRFRVKDQVTSAEWAEIVARDSR